MFKFSAYLSSRLLNKTYVLLHIFCAIVTHRLCIKVSIIILTGSGKKSSCFSTTRQVFYLLTTHFFQFATKYILQCFLFLHVVLWSLLFHNFQWLCACYVHTLLKHPGAYFYTMIFNKFHWKIHNLISRFHKAKLKRNLQKTQLRVLGMFKNTEYM